MKVVVGLSGGVDSAVCASLLKDRGHEVYGVCLAMGNETQTEDARRVAEYLDIDFKIVDMSACFYNDVIVPFSNEYLNGHTPNPCLICNRSVKWKGMLDYADSIGVDYVATGHYARIAITPEGRYHLIRNIDNPKDQTYALYQLSQEQLSRTMMPLSGMTKDEIREIAKDKGIPVAEKEESMEICFIPDHDYASYIEKVTGCNSVPGNFVDEDGNVLGKHKGLIHYTVGQRKKLGIALGHPVYVTRIDTEKNEIVLGNDDRTGSHTVYFRDVFYQGSSPMNIGDALSGTGRIRYNHPGASCRIVKTGDDLFRAEFDDYVRAVTPGQACVFYCDNALMLGGTICIPVVAGS